MRGYMFKSRWGALLFVCLTVYGAVSLIGDEEDEGTLLSAADTLTHSRAEFSENSAALSAPNPRPVLDAGSADAEVLSEGSVSSPEEDDYLIDTAQGIDPSPDVDPDVPTGTPAEQGDEYVLVEITEGEEPSESD